MIKPKANANPAKDQWFPSQCYKWFKFTQLKNSSVQFCLFQSFPCMLINTAYKRLLKESPEEIRKLKYTSRTTIFSLQKYFKCQEGNNHWTLAKYRSRLTSIAPSSNSPCPSSSSPWPLSSAPPSSPLYSMKPVIQKYCKKSIELNICK